ncbi:MAG: SprT-like domain-containing protein [bacterium]
MLTFKGKLGLFIMSNKRQNIKIVTKKKVVKRRVVKKKAVQPIFENIRTNDDLKDIMETFRKKLNIDDNVDIRIKFGRKARRVLGSVKLVEKTSLIKISKYMCDYRVPEYVLKEVILHEMIHIKTGHGSVLQKQYEHAHRGGVIRKEMALVGEEELYDTSDKWVKTNWFKHVRSYNMRERQIIKKMNND